MTNQYQFQICVADRVLRWILVSLLLLTEVLQVDAQTYEWGNVAIGGGGFVSAIITSKTEQDLVYARTDVGGAYRWDETNSRWIPLLDWVSVDQLSYMGVESLATDPQNPNRLYLLVGTSYFNSGKSAILKSEDYGNTFTIIDVTSQFHAHGNGMGRQNGEKLIIDPNNSDILYCGSRDNGLFKSTDAGLTWVRQSGLDITTTPNENGISLVVMDPSSVSGGATQTLFVGISKTGTNFYKSTDDGQSFTAVSGAPSDLMPQRAVYDGNGNIYITYGNGAGPHGHWSEPEPFDLGELWKYNIAGDSWTNVSPPENTRPFGGISVDPNDPNRLICSSTNNWVLQENGHGDQFFITTDGGASWTDIIARGFDMDPNGVPWIDNSSIHWCGSIEFDPFNTKRAWVTSGNGIFRTEDIDATTNVWKFMMNGLEETVPQSVVSIPGGPLISVILDYDGFRHTDITQYEIRHTPSMGSTTGLDFAGQASEKILRVGEAMYYSTDTGITWTETAVINGSKGKVALSADGDVLLHAPEGQTTTYRSTDNGSVWSAVSGLNILNAFPVSDRVNPNKFYAYNPSTGAVMVSSDGGVSFSQTTTVATGGSKVIRTIPDFEGDIWIPLGSGGLTRSTNSGSSFSTVSGVTTCDAVGYGRAAEGSGYHTIFIWGTVDNVLGIYRSVDEGVTWERVNDDAHEYGGLANGQFVVGDMNVFGRVYMSTAGRGIVYGEPAGASGSMTVSSSSLSFSSSGGSSDITVTSSESWNAASSDQDWLSVSPSSGSGTGNVSVTTTQNSDSNDRSGMVTFSTSSITRVVEVIQSGCTKTTITPYVQVNEGALQSTSSLSVTAGDLVVLSPEPATGGSWSWSGPNAFSATGREVTLSSIQVDQAGEYIATYTNESGCQSTKSITLTVENILKLPARQGHFELYPNPSDKGVFYINIPQESGGVNINIFDVLGKLVHKQFTKGKSQIVVNSKLTKGLYIVNIQTETSAFTRKLTIQ